MRLSQTLTVLASVLLMTSLLTDAVPAIRRPRTRGRGRGPHRSRNTNRNLNRRRNDNPVIQPGIKARITQHGFDFASNLAIEVLLLQLQQLRIPDMTQTIGMAEATVSNIRISDFPKPDSRIESIPGFGVRWRGTRMHPYVTADYSALFDLGFWTVAKTGTLSAQGRNMVFVVDFFIGRHTRTGRPIAEVNSCRCTGRLSVAFNGQWSDMLTMGAQVFQDEIEGVIHSQICNNIRTEINTRLNGELTKMPMSMPLDSQYIVDYHLVRYPEFFPGAMETYSRGVVLAKSETGRHEPPFSPTPMPLMSNHTDRMFYVYVSDYTLNTGLYAAYRNDHLRHIIDANLLPQEMKHYLNTTCPTSHCLGSLFPRMRRMYPDSVLYLDVHATRAPKVNISDYVFNISVWAQADFFLAPQTAERRTLIFNMDVLLNFVTQVVIDGNRVVFNVTEVTSRAQMKRSRVGPMSSTNTFDQFLRGALQQHFLPVVQAHGTRGVEFPVLPNVLLYNIELVPSEVGNIIIAGGDLAFNLTMPAFEQIQ